MMLVPYILHDGWMNFPDIWYHDLIPWDVEQNLAVYQIGVIMPIFSYSLSFCCDISENNVVILFIK